MSRMILVSLTLCLAACAGTAPPEPDPPGPNPDFFLGADRTHTRFSRSIPPAITVPSGSVIEVQTHEATGGQLDIDSAGNTYCQPSSHAALGYFRASESGSSTSP